MNNKVNELAKELANNWVANYTLSGRTAFLANEKAKNVIVAKAEELGVYDEVYTVANQIMRGEVRV
jgi:hypothetical protein